jgi:hypothetical protein
VDGETVEVLEDYPGSIIELVFEEIACFETCHSFSIADEIKNNCDG